jgi:tRNA dimethylallyltransferase
LSKPPRVTLIAGPTASGKSALALKMARDRGAVIINADSQQLYADLRVLTARPSLDDETQAPHHLYGIADASQAWSVGQWSRAVLDLLDDLGDRPALLVGGTGLYFNALAQGLADIPPVDNTLRDQIQIEFDQWGEADFRRQLAEHDPQSAAAITPGDRQRLVRALSVARGTGRSLSAWKAETRPLLAPDTYDRLVLEPERDRLYANCDARVHMMIEQGALDEVRALMLRGLDPSLPAMKAVGVPELMAHLRGETSLPTAITALQQATRNYAKRQLTWFRNQCRDWPRV